MDELVHLRETPVADKVYMIAGWQQWADAGAISSALPQYLVDRLAADKIGEMDPDQFYLFQIPGTHHLVRPQIKLQDGYRERIETKKNEFYYSGKTKNGLAIFMGYEPHRNEERYADAFLDAAQALGVKRIVAVAGVYGPMPYEKDREVSCVYSLPRMKAELKHYAVSLSDYEGGSTIDTYIADRAEPRGIEFVALFAMVPYYDLTQLSPHLSGVQIGQDYKAWYDLLRRLDYMFGLGLDLADLGKQAEKLIASIDAQIERLDASMPQLQVRAHINELTKDFTEKPFMPLGDAWERELEDLFKDLEE